MKESVIVLIDVNFLFTLYSTSFSPAEKLKTIKQTFNAINKVTSPLFEFKLPKK